MRLASFFRRNGAATYGIASADGLVDAGSRFADRWPDLRSVLAGDAVGDLARLCADETADVGFDDVEWLPPIPNPTKIFCVGLNYKAHAAEIGREVGDKPTIFVRFADTQVGHGQPIVRPIQSTQLDFEAELAVVIGRGGRHIDIKDAFAHIAGYSIYNDVSLRDWQGHTQQYTPGKNFPSTGPFGPWIVTADAIDDIARLRLRTRVNGTTLQDGCIDDLIFSVPQILSYLSSFTYLYPGDVVITGTPSGVGSMRRPPVWLKPGDIVEIDIDEIGTLSNPVVQEA